MIKKIVKVLNIVRTFGFLMVAALVFASVAPLLTVQGHGGFAFESLGDEGGGGGSSTPPPSNEEIQEEYDEIEAMLSDDLRIQEALEDYLILHEDGTMELYIPGDVTLDVTQEEIDGVLAHINDLNEMIDDGDVVVSSEFEIFTPRHDLEFAQMTPIYNVKLTWRNVSFRLTPQGAIILGVGAIAFHFYQLVSGVKNMFNLVENNALAGVLGSLMFVLPAHAISHTVVNMINNNMALIVTALLALNLTLMTLPGRILKIVVDFVIGQFLPSLVTAAQMVADGFSQKHYQVRLFFWRLKSDYRRV